MDTFTLAQQIRDGATLPQRCPDHRRYIAGCAECKRLARTRSRARHRAAAYGWLNPSHMSADQAREHIIRLRDEHSMSLNLIAAEARVSFTAVRNIAEGITCRSRTETVESILAVQPKDAPLPHGLVRAVGAARRLQGLAHAHYSSDDLAPMLGTLPEIVRRWRANTTGMIGEHRHASIRDLACALDGTHGQARKAHAHALRQGWVSLAAWDDIDDPRAEPSTPAGRDDLVDDVAIEMALNGEMVKLTRLERHHAVHRGQQSGMTLAAIERALRLSGSYVNELAHRPLPTYGLAA